VLPWLAACTIEQLAAIESAWPWAPPPPAVLTTVSAPVFRVLVVVVIVVGRVVVVAPRRRNGPPWAGPASTTTSVVIAIRILISTSLGYRTSVHRHPSTYQPRVLALGIVTITNRSMTVARVPPSSTDRA
jgi:hypothetical protein